MSRVYFAKISLVAFTLKGVPSPRKFQEITVITCLFGEMRDLPFCADLDFSHYSWKLLFPKKDSMGCCVPNAISLADASSLNSLLDFLPTFFWCSRVWRDSLDLFLVNILSTEGGGGV